MTLVGGYKIKINMAYATCPCVDAHTWQADPNCALCKGSGTITLNNTAEGHITEAPIIVVVQFRDGETKEIPCVSQEEAQTIMRNNQPDSILKNGIEHVWIK